VQSTSLNGFLVRNDQSWLQCLENSYAALRTSWQSEWVGLPAVLAHCVQYLGLNHDDISLPASQMLKAADSVAHQIEIGFAKEGHEVAFRRCHHHHQFANCHSIAFVSREQ
jgi:hypothetical protein